LVDLTGYTGVVKIRFRCIRGNGAIGDVAVDDILISSYPNLNLGPDKNICSGMPTTLNAGAGAGYTYAWRNLPSPTIIGTSQTLVVSAAGNYNVVVTDPYGLTAEDTIIIGVLPPPVVSFFGLPTNICVNAGTYVLSGTPTGGTFMGSGIVGSSFIPTMAGAGTHSISYAYTNITVIKIIHYAHNSILYFFCKAFRY